MIVKNVRIFTEEHSIKKGSVLIDNGRISKVICDGLSIEDFEDSNKADDVFDGKNMLLIPGMIDIHLHGAVGYDFSDGSVEAFEKISNFLLFQGVTSFMASTMTLPVGKLKKVIDAGIKFRNISNKASEFSSLVGLNMEGPFISSKKKGAQNNEYILDIDSNVFDELFNVSDGIINTFGLAPEKDNAISFIRKYKDDVNISIAHSDASYEEAINSFDSGVCHITHLFNGMSEMLHRSPGIAGAFFDTDKDVTAELICDNYHIHQSIIRMTFKLKGDKIIAISDSIRATGLEDGTYDLGGQDVIVRNKMATLLRDGSIAGAVKTLPECFKILVNEAGIPFENAVLAVTENPAKYIKKFDETGSVSKGKRADLLLINDNMDVVNVIKDGKLIR